MPDVVSLGACWQERHFPAWVGAHDAPPPETTCSCGTVTYRWVRCADCGEARWRVA